MNISQGTSRKDTYKNINKISVSPSRKKIKFIAICGIAHLLFVINATAFFCDFFLIFFLQIHLSFAALDIMYLVRLLLHTERSAARYCQLPLSISCPSDRYHSSGSEGQHCPFCHLHVPRRGYLWLIRHLQYDEHNTAIGTCAL